MSEEQFNIPDDVMGGDRELVQSILVSRGKRKGLLLKSAPSYHGDDPEKYLLWWFTAPALLPNVRGDGFMARMMGHHAVSLQRAAEIGKLADKLVEANKMAYVVGDDGRVALRNGRGMTAVLDWCGYLNDMNERHLAVVIMGAKEAPWDATPHNIRVMAEADDYMATAVGVVKKAGVGETRRQLAEVSGGRSGGSYDMWIKAVHDYFKLGEEGE